MNYLNNKEYAKELYHHGILGMKWGKRNGPPYPLDSKIDYTGYYESKDFFVITDDMDTIVIDKNKGVLGLYGLEVFADKCMNGAVYWEKKNGKWTSIPAIETFG